MGTAGRPPSGLRQHSCADGRSRLHSGRTKCPQGPEFRDRPVGWHRLAGRTLGPGLDLGCPQVLPKMGALDPGPAAEVREARARRQGTAAQAGPGWPRSLGDRNRTHLTDQSWTLRHDLPAWTCHPGPAPRTGRPPRSLRELPTSPSQGLWVQIQAAKGTPCSAGTWARPESSPRAGQQGRQLPETSHGGSGIDPERGIHTPTPEPADGT